VGFGVSAARRRLRIAQVAPPIERVPPIGYGGTERIVHELTSELVRRGHEVTTFASGDSDVAGRTGGDEFAALLVHSGPDLGPRFVTRVRHQVAELGGTPGLPPTVSISAGFAHFPTEAGSAEALFELADARLYDAKRSRNS